ncbi:MAG: efflux RND transporter permease subunit [Calditrichia bacterium]
MRHRLLTLLFAGIILAAAVRFIAPLLDVELLPAINEGEFRIELTLPEGTQLDVTDHMTKEIENALAKRHDVAQYYTLVGVFSARGELKPNFSTITIQLKPEYYQSLPQIMQQMREQWKNFPGTKVVVRQTDVTEGMRREPVNVRIVGDDLNTLSEIGQRVLREVAGIPGIVNLNSSVQEGLSEFGIHINRVKAADLGLSTGQISNAVRLAVLGSSITRFSTYGEEYDITVRADENKVKTINNLLNVPVANINGKVIPLEALATVSLEQAPSEIKRIDQQRIVEIKADVAGRNQRQVIADVRNAAAGIKLPSGYFITYGGQSKAIVESFKSLLAAMAIAIFLVYVVMGAQFNSFLHPFTIAFTIPLALIGVFLGLLLFGANLSMNALLGMIMLVGIVVNNGILLIDYINQLRSRGIEKNEAIVQAGATRLRPILITSLTTIFGMLPIALGLGEGGEALQPLGAVVVGGLATSTFLTLLVIPCVYSLVDRFSRTKTGRGEI